MVVVVVTGETTTSPTATKVSEVCKRVLWEAKLDRKLVEPVGEFFGRAVPTNCLC